MRANMAVRVAVAVEYVLDYDRGDDCMGVLIGLLGFVGLIIGIISLIRPLKIRRIKSRKQAGTVIGISFVLVLIGGALTPTEDADSDVVASDTTTTVADVDSTTTTSPDETTTTVATTTTTTLPPTTTTTTTLPPTTTTTTTTTSTTTTTTIPPNPGNTKNCGDFSTWAEAQAWYDLYYPHYGDIGELDGDGDGTACESLPGAP